MKYTSENMNYIFNVSYFDDLDWAAFGSSKEENDSILKQHNDAIRDFSFKIASAGGKMARIADERLYRFSALHAVSGADDWNW